MLEKGYILKEKATNHGFLYKSIKNRIIPWLGGRMYLTEAQQLKIVLQWCKMLHLKEQTKWHIKINNVMIKKYVNQLLCENKEVK